MFNWLFKNRSAERRALVRSAPELARERDSKAIKHRGPAPYYGKRRSS